MALQFAQTIEAGDGLKIWQFIPAETDVDWLNGTRALPPFHNSTFSIKDEVIYEFGVFLNQTLHFDPSYSDVSSNYISQSLLYPANITDIMANAAESVTIYLRQNTPNSTTALGHVWQQVTVVEIRWPWLILPALIVFTTTVVLFAAVLCSKSDSSAATSWKSSSLPFLFHGIRDWSHDEWEVLYAGKLESIKQMSAAATAMDVNLCKAVGSGTALARHDLGVDERQTHRPASGQEE